MSAAVAYLDEAREIIRHLDVARREAVLIAIYEEADRWDREAAQYGLAHSRVTSPARRRVGVLESVRGVKCCNPAAVRTWSLFRRCSVMFAVAIVVASAWVAVTMPWVLVVVLLVVCVVAWLVGLGMVRMRTPVCH